MPDKIQGVDEKLKQLQRDYIARLPEKVDHVEKLWGKFKSTANDMETLAELHRAVHGLAGSGATFGLPSISQQARSSEILIKARIKEEEAVTKDFIEQIDKLLGELAARARDPGDPADMTTGAVQVAAEDNHRILLVDSDSTALRELADQLKHYAYEVNTVSASVFTPDVLENFKPAVMIADTKVIDHWGEALADAARCDAEKCSFIFTSYETDIESRLKAVKAGGGAYFPKPVNFSLLIDRVNTLTKRSLPEPYRVLIVDDSVSLASFLSTLLEANGIRTLTVNDPLEILEPLYHFQPDIVLMDIYMPHCRGTELAQVIRQDPKFVSVPIVYLSTEKDVDVQLLAMSHGGDDFLTKPIIPEQLLSTISSRCARSRMIRDSIVRDSLTGLFNHSYFQDQLDREIALSDRSGQIFSLCMLDVDYFKAVNDTYGHQLGDQVLKSLSNFLSNRLRKTDILGRYGGEEFVALLPGCGSDRAFEIIDEIRSSFAKVVFQSGGKNFNVTFSAGISVYHKGATSMELVSKADKALYRAKFLGRNQVVLAGD